MRQYLSIALWIFAFATSQALGPKPKCSVCQAEPTGASPGAAPVPATVIEVRNEFELQSALSNLQPGTTLKIASGVYRGGWAVREVERLTIEALDMQQPPEFRGGNSAWHFSRCAHLTLRHLRIKGQRQNGINVDDGGQLDRPTTDLLVEGLQIEEIGPQGNHDAIKLSGIDRLVVRKCRLHGWAGQGIDMVGCHHGLIEECRFEGKDGFSASAGVQAKGGSSDIRIEHCHFIDAGQRPINAGGSTGLPYFRPQDATFEAARITIENNRIEGSPCAVAFVGVDGALLRQNTILYPTRWIFRMLQETTGPRFVPCRQVIIEDNCIVFRRSQVTSEVNVGSGTAPETLRFKGNRWLAEDRPESSRPRLPVDEVNGQYGNDCRSAH